MDKEDLFDEFLEATKDIKPLKEEDLPWCFYDQDGNRLEVVTDMESIQHNFFAENVNDALTLHRGFKTKKVVGFELNRFSHTNARIIKWALGFLATKGVDITDELSNLLEETRKGVAGAAAYHGDTPTGNEA